MELLLDENVPASVGKIFLRCGHSVEDSRVIIAPGAADPLIAQACDSSGCILVTWDEKDFKRMAKRFKKMDLITFRCDANDAAALAEFHMDTIEFLYEKHQKTGHRMFLTITKTTVQSRGLEVLRS